MATTRRAPDGRCCAQTSDPSPFPHSSQVEGELRELRCHYGRELYRILYRRSRNLVVLLHMFRTDTGKLTEREIQIAKDRWADFKERPKLACTRRKDSHAQVWRAVFESAYGTWA